MFPACMSKCVPNTAVCSNAMQSKAELCGLNASPTAILPALLCMWSIDCGASLEHAMLQVHDGHEMIAMTVSTDLNMLPFKRHPS